MVLSMQTPKKRELGSPIFNLDSLTAVKFFSLTAIAFFVILGDIHNSFIKDNWMLFLLTLNLLLPPHRTFLLIFSLMIINKMVIIIS
jgi:hypothetical protein